MTDNQSHRLPGTKRSRQDTEQQNTLSSQYTFTFVPPLVPGQKLFDLNSDISSNQVGHKESWSPATLASRYRRRRQEQQQLAHRRSRSNNIPPVPAQHAALTDRLLSFPSASSSSAPPPPPTWHTFLPLAYNIILLLPLVYILFFLVYTFHHDFRIKTEAHQAAILQDVSTCAKNYEINQCNPSTRVPALEEQCRAWEACTSRNPTMISRSVILGEMMGEALNSFIEPISFKAVVFYSILVALLVVTNLRWYSHARLSSRR